MGKNPPFQISAFLRVLLLIASAAFLPVILATPALVLALFDRSGAWCSSFQRAWVRAFFRLNRIPIRIEGREDLRDGDTNILIFNHASLLDIPAIVAAVPLRCGLWLKSH